MNKMMESKKYINVIQHLAFEDLGSFGKVFQSQGFEIRYYHAGVNIPELVYQDEAILVVLGGPIGVYETDNYPYLQQEIDGLKNRIQNQLPTLGICLGAQLLVAASGAKVYAGHVKEIGWSTLQLSEQGFASPLKHLHDVNVLHWHGDTFDLPKSATLLASSEHYPHQAFAMGKHILAMQFHPEADTNRFEQWLIGHCSELNHAKIDIPKLRADNQRFGATLAQAGEKLLREWLDEIGALLQ